MAATTKSSQQTTALVSTLLTNTPLQPTTSQTDFVETTTIVYTTTLPPTPHNCEWPRNLKPLHECCSIPYHANFKVQRDCMTNTAIAFNRSGNITSRESYAKCYLEKTKLWQNGKFNKEIAKEIYRNYTNIYKVMTGSDPWYDVIGEAVDKCDFPNTSLMSVNLANYYICTNRYLVTRCAIIDSSDDCEPVEEHYEKCRKVQTACSTWPMKVMLPEFCCIYPELVSKSVLLNCRKECSTKIIQLEVAKCVIECVEKSVGAKTNGKYNFDVVKNVLMANANKNSRWEGSITKSVEYCKSLIQGKINYCIQGILKF